MIRRVVCGFVLLAVLCSGAERPSKTLWWTSVAVLSAASIADVRSSWGRTELNPVLRGPDGRFGARGLAVKLSATGAGTFLQWLVVRKRPSTARPLVVMNTALAGMFAGAAIHNSR
jgi:hypothetical protein